MSNTVEIVQTQSLASATQTIETVVVVQEAAPEIVEVVAAGPQGIQGPPGSSSNDAAYILGVPITFADEQPDDLLSFTGSAWVNKPQAQVTDGGNF